MMRGIDIAELPRTFRDAIHITRALRVDYLWIDSLCIIQDDPHDWKMESRLMERVYSSAYVTLAASCASGTDDGFLKARPWRQCVVMKSNRGTPYYVCDTIDDFGRDVDQGELNKRAWVLQERVLSRRTIYFTEKQSYWECGKGVRCETLTQMRNRKASFLGDANFPKSIDTFVRGMKIQLFQDLYEKYSNLALTSKGDRPVAIRGLETRLIRTFKTLGGYGIFDCYLHRCLLWQRSSKPLKRINSFRGGHVPSWSWMAYDGGIRYLDVPFGKILWAADLVPPFAAWRTQQSTETDELDMLSEMEVPVWELMDAGSAELILDEPGRAFGAPFRCVIVGRNKEFHDEACRLCYVLIVCFLADDGDREMYERVGVAKLKGEQIATAKRTQKCFIK